MSNDLPAKKGRGTVNVSAQTCKGCAYCIDFCPTKCLEFSQEYNTKGYHFPMLVRPEDCSGCNLCGMYCPDFAIYGFKFQELEGRKQGGEEVIKEP